MKMSIIFLSINVIEIIFVCFQKCLPFTRLLNILLRIVTNRRLAHIVFDEIILRDTYDIDKQ